MVPRISVVLPVRDAAATLEAALESLAAQTEPAWECLAVDDGSRDGSRTLLDTWARRDVRVRVLATPRPGLVAALEHGLRHARAPIIARMDADDGCHPERLARQLAHLERHPEVGLVASRVAFGGAPERQAGYARHVAWTNGLLTHADIARARFIDSPLAHPSVMFRRALLERHGGYAEGDFPEDYDLWLRWLGAGVRMEKLPEVLLTWNDSPGRLSRTDRRYAPGAFARLKARHLARWLAGSSPHHPAVVVWGAGRLTRRRAACLAEHGVEIAAWVDIDPRKVGRRLDGRPVLAPAQLPPPGSCFVLSWVSSLGAREEIACALRDRGWVEGVHFLLAA